MNSEFDPLKRWKIAPPRDSARQRALEASLRVLRSTRAEKPSKWRFPLGLAMAGGAVAALVLATLILLRPASGGSLDSGTLAEFQTLFGSALTALIERDGEIEIVTAENPPIKRGQPILINAETTEGPVKMVGFSGSRFDWEVNGERIGIEPLVEADGSILLCGEDFLWGPHLKMGALPASIKNLRAIPLVPAT